MGTLTRRRLWTIGRVHKLLSVLADPRMRCSGKSSRAVSRLWFNMDAAAIKPAIRAARRLGLVNVRFRNPYIVGHGENFISLTPRGDQCVDAGRALLQNKEGERP